MRCYVLTVVGRDRPGIVAAVTAPLRDVEANIADSEMAILRGHFTMMLMVNIGDEVDASDLEHRLAAVSEELGLESVFLREVTDLHVDYPEGSHSLTVYGADHPGIVAAVTETLADVSVNIVDLSTRVIGEDGEPVYVMGIEVVLPEGMDGEKLSELLSSVGGEQRVEISVQELDRDAF